MKWNEHVVVDLTPAAVSGWHYWAPRFAVTCTGPGKVNRRYVDELWADNVADIMDTWLDGRVAYDSNVMRDLLEMKVLVDGHRSLSYANRVAAKYNDQGCGVCHVMFRGVIWNSRADQTKHGYITMYNKRTGSAYDKLKLMWHPCGLLDLDVSAGSSYAECDVCTEFIDLFAGSLASLYTGRYRKGEKILGLGAPKVTVSAKKEAGMDKRIKSLFEGVDTKYITEEWIDAYTVMSLSNENVYLWGPPGTGKTHIAEMHGTEGRVVRAVTVNEESSTSVLMGYDRIRKDGSMAWQYGPASVCWKEGGILVVNEIGEASSEVQTALHAITDDPELAEYTLPTDEVLHPAEGFRCIGTTNVDPTLVDAALIDRFTVLRIDHPSPHAIMALPEHLRDLAFEACSTSEPSRRTSLRPWFRFVNFVQSDIQTSAAVRLAFGKNAEVTRALVAVYGSEVS